MTGKGYQRRSQSACEFAVKRQLGLRLRGRMLFSRAFHEPRPIPGDKMMLAGFAGLGFAEQRRGSRRAAVQTLEEIEL
jgi:hypothetical protein